MNNTTNTSQIPPKNDVDQINQIVAVPDAEAFADLILKVEFGPLHVQLYKHFNAEMLKAITGRICTPERMAALYPIFREINKEQEEIAKIDRRYELKALRKSEKASLVH